MDTLLLLKFAHVSAAVLWVGGGFGLMLAAATLGSRASSERMAAILSIMATLAPRLFVPASLVVLISGISLGWFGGYGWPAWLVLGLAGIAATIALGAGLLGPGSERALRTAAKAGPEAARSDMERVFRLARFDYVLHGAIVFLMVVKPGWDEVGLLAALALAVAAGATLILRTPGLRAA